MEEKQTELNTRFNDDNWPKSAIGFSVVLFIVNTIPKWSDGAFFQDLEDFLLILTLSVAGGIIWAYALHFYHFKIKK